VPLRERFNSRKFGQKTVGGIIKRSSLLPECFAALGETPVKGERFQQKAARCRFLLHNCLVKKPYHGLAGADSNDNYFDKVMEKFIL